MGLAHGAQEPLGVRDGLVLYLDAANARSYPRSGTTWFDRSSGLPPRSGLSAVEVLVVAGGGAGGGGIGGGGGGGGVIYMPSANITPLTSYTITVGAGGASAVYSSTSGSGGDSSAFGALAKGGGGSGVHDSGDGVAGGSGGGAASNNGRINVGGSASGSSLGGNTGTIYGNRGGNMLVSRTGGPTAAAGGGGAGTAAADTNSNIVQTSPGNANGRGGDGILNSILGTPYYWGGGGGGGAYFNGYAGNGGLGGGGGGSCSSGSGPTSGGGSALNSGSGAAINTNGGAGGTNTGGGGGGGAWQVTSGGAGGSGIVIVRYPGSQRATGGTVTSVAGDTIHTFTTSGTFTTNGENNGTLVNGVGYSGDNFGSLVFDGTNDVVNSTTSIIDRADGQEITVSCWIKPSRTSGQYSVFCANRSDNMAIYNWIFYQHTTDGAIAFHGDAQNKSSYVPITNVWINVTNTVTASGVSTLYVNGVSTYTVTGYTYGNGTPSRLGIGAEPGGQEPFQGNISQVSIYNRALTASEVSQNYNALKSRYI